jgi:hypothetical protein
VVKILKIKKSYDGSIRIETLNFIYYFNKLNINKKAFIIIYQIKKI